MYNFNPLNKEMAVLLLVNLTWIPPRQNFFILFNNNLKKETFARLNFKWDSFVGEVPFLYSKDYGNYNFQFRHKLKL